MASIVLIVVLVVIVVVVVRAVSPNDVRNTARSLSIAIVAVVIEPSAIAFQGEVGPSLSEKSCTMALRLASSSTEIFGSFVGNRRGCAAVVVVAAVAAVVAAGNAVGATITDGKETGGHSLSLFT